MEKDQNTYRILVVEDNPGDFLLIEEYLLEHIQLPKLTRAKSYEEAQKELQEKVFDCVFLDLSLPDKSGSDLVRQVVQLSKGSPVIVLTGYADMDFSIQSIALGVSDYLLKDDLTAFGLYKSLLYNLESKRKAMIIAASEKRYSDLFHLSPQPMWLYDLDSLQFLDVNNAAINHYGYTFEEFMGMSIKDIRPKEDLPKLMKAITSIRKRGRMSDQTNIFRHTKKEGAIIYVDIRSNSVSFNGTNAQLVLANDITDRLNYIKAIEQQNDKLRDIAWVQSHVVRTPLSRLMAIANLLQEGADSEEETTELLQFMKQSADELDAIINDISSKTDGIDFGEEPEGFSDILD